jgi:hypothetical protein
MKRGVGEKENVFPEHGKLNEMETIPAKYK